MLTGYEMDYDAPIPAPPTPQAKTLLLPLVGPLGTVPFLIPLVTLLILSAELRLKDLAYSPQTAHLFICVPFP